MLNRKNFVLSALVLGASALVAGTFAQAADYSVDSGHSSVSFKIKSKDAYYVQGIFGQLSGKFSVGESAEKTQFNFTVKAESINTGNEGRDKHLRSPDFFNVQQFPEIKFASKTVKATAAGFDVAGEITLLGQTKPVNVVFTKVGQAKGQKGEEVVGYEATFEVDRSEFGMKYGAGMIDNKVKVTVDFAGAAAK